MAKKPAPKTPPQPQRPNLAQLKAETEAAAQLRSNRQPGSVVNKQIDTQSAPYVGGGQPFFAYYVLDPLEMKAGRLQRERDKLTERGYWLADGEEYVPECTTAEVWMTFHDIAQARRDARAAAWAEKSRNPRRLALQ